MPQRSLRTLAVLVVMAALAWLGRAATQRAEAPRWTEVAPGVLRGPGPIAGYALCAGDKALLIDAPHGADGLAEHGVQQVERVLLTHYHRDVCAAVASFQCPVAAPVKAEEWLQPDKVQKYWRDSLPLRGSRTAYLVHPTGFPGLHYTLTDGMTIDWHGWKLRVIDTPGHALAHVAVAAQKEGGPNIVFCGGAFASAGKLWAPYTTDWDHWTDAGLKPTAASLRKLLDLRPDVLCPSRGPVVRAGIEQALQQTLTHVEEVGFLKSFERFTKQRLGDAPQYRFLTKEQATSNGSLPWSRVCDHLWITGNTYVLVSRDNTCLMFDPWGKRSADQFAKLQTDQKLGPLEVVMFSHAHFDHYDGIHDLPGRERFEIWALDQVATPIATPFRLRAPFLDARPVKFDRTPHEGETLSWREYRFRFHFLPGQSEFTMGVETTIDGKHCLFTADNFFHQDMFSGSGGWMGLNRSFPPRYAASARKVLTVAPEWVLAEHGGPFEFSAEDFRRRVAWGESAARAADALSPSGNHMHDWNPHHLRVEPLVQKARAGAPLKAELVIANVLDGARKLRVELHGRGLTPEQAWDLEVAANETTRRELTIPLGAATPAGRQVFALRAVGLDGSDSSDAFLVADVEPQDPPE
jgi:glyoxylase-like metal-dependent hydrolase (beta-lactamase superfamily II)